MNNYTKASIVVIFGFIIFVIIYLNIQGKVTTIIKKIKKPTVTVDKNVDAEISSVIGGKNASTEIPLDTAIGGKSNSVQSSIEEETLIDVTIPDSQLTVRQRIQKKKQLLKAEMEEKKRLQEQIITQIQNQTKEWERISEERKQLEEQKTISDSDLIIQKSKEKLAEEEARLVAETEQRRLKQEELTKELERLRQQKLKAEEEELRLQQEKEYCELTVRADVCKDPLTFYNKCNNYKDADKLKDLADYCMFNKHITKDNYNIIKNKLAEQNVTIRDFTEVDCGTESNLCANAKDIVTWCGPKSSRTPDYYKLPVQQCAYNNEISNDDYNYLINYFKSVGINLVEKPNVDCKEATSDYCKDPINYMNCKELQGVPQTNDFYVKMAVNECKLRGKMNNEVYAKVQDYFSKKGITLPNYPDYINCTDSYCTSPSDFYTYCKDEIRELGFTNPVDYAESVNVCGLQGKTSLQEYEKAKQMFAGLNVELSELPETSYIGDECGELMGYLLTKSLRRPITTIEEDLNHAIYCRLNGKVSDSEFARAQQYFAKKGVVLPDLPSIDCEEPELYFKNPADYIEYCRRVNPQDISLETDLANIRRAGVDGKTSPEQYERARQYFRTKGLELIELPDITCQGFDPINNIVSYFKYCKYIDSPPTQIDIEKDMNSVLNWALNGIVTDEEYKKAQDYFTSIGYTLQNKPPITCNPSPGFCTNPTDIMTYCGLQGQTLQQTFNGVKNCAVVNQITPEEYERARQYFASKDLFLGPMPDINCQTSTFCDDPASFYEYCNDTNYTSLSNDDLTRKVRECGLTSIANDKYKKAQDYFASTKSINIPDKPSIDCNNQTFDYWCQNASAQINECGYFKQTSEPVLQTDYATKLKSCANNNKITKDQYNTAKALITSPLPEFPEQSCSLNFCDAPVNTITSCDPLNNIVRSESEYMTKIKDCLLRNSTSQSEYDKLKQYYMILDKPLPEKSDADCSTTNLTNRPVTQMKYCDPLNDVTTDYQKNLNIVTVNGIMGTTSLEEYNKAISYFAEKGYTLPELPDVDCNSITFCNDPASFSKYCKPISSIKNSTIDDDVTRTNNCTLYNYGEMTADKFNKSKTYFQSKGKTLAVNDFPDVNCADPNITLCSNPASVIKYCYPLRGVKEDPMDTFQKVKMCGINKQTSDEEYKKAQDYFLEKYNVVLPNKPTIDCSTTKLCDNPSEFLTYCKDKYERTTDAQDRENVLNCKRYNEITDDNYNKASDYFKSLNNGTGEGLPDFEGFDCMKDDICTNPYVKIKYCRPLSTPVNDTMDITAIQSCGRNDNITTQSYSRMQQYYQEMGLNLPDMFSCKSTPYCQDPIVHANNCSYPWVNQLPATKYCLQTNQTSQDKFQSIKNKYPSPIFLPTECLQLSKLTQDNFCAPQDCVADPVVWGSCNTTDGTRIGTYNIKQQAIGLGTPCPTSITDTTTCPINCQYSDWTSGQCNTSTFKRTFTRTLTNPGRGVTCDSLIKEEDDNSCQPSYLYNTDLSVLGAGTNDWSIPLIIYSDYSYGGISTNVTFNTPIKIVSVNSTRSDYASRISYDQIFVKSFKSNPGVIVKIYGEQTRYNFNNNTLYGVKTPEYTVTITNNFTNITDWLKTISATILTNIKFNDPSYDNGRWLFHGRGELSNYSWYIVPISQNKTYSAPLPPFVLYPSINFVGAGTTTISKTPINIYYNNGSTWGADRIYYYKSLMIPPNKTTTVILKKLSSGFLETLTVNLTSNITDISTWLPTKFTLFDYSTSTITIEATNIETDTKTVPLDITGVVYSQRIKTKPISLIQRIFSWLN